AIGGRVYVIGGRGALVGTPTARIVAVDPAARRIVAAGALPQALSDLAAVSLHDRILVAGGRGDGTVPSVLLLEPSSRRAPAAGAVPALVDAHDVYAADTPGNLTGPARFALPRIYVPNSRSNTVDVIDPATYRVVGHFPVGVLPQHVVPSYDLAHLYVTNDVGNTLTVIDPRTAKPTRTIAVTDPYHMYFTPDGTKALVSCEFTGQLLELDVPHQRIVRSFRLNGGHAMPQDVKLSPDGRVFYVADMVANGVWIVSAQTWRTIGFVHTGSGAHGLYPSRNARDLYVSNRGAGSVSVLSFATRKVVRTWQIPGGGSPDMGGVSADGKVLWLSGRYNSVVYAISTTDGKLLAKIPVGDGPHGLCVWPQPGRYSLSHTGILR